MMSSNFNVKTEEKQILLTPPASKRQSVLSNKQEQAVNVVELPEEKSSRKRGLDVYKEEKVEYVDQEVMEDNNLLTAEKGLVLNPFYYEENVSEEEELLENCGMNVNKEG